MSCFFPFLMRALAPTSILILAVAQPACAGPTGPPAAPPEGAREAALAHRETAGALDWDDDGAESLPFVGSGMLPQELPRVTQGGFPSYPLPEGEQPPLGRGVFNSGFRDPLPKSPVWNPAGPKRVGLQAGHWYVGDLPWELRRLSPGTSAGGWAEWQVNLLIAQAAAAMLEEAGVEVDVLPTVIPPRYRAHAFLSIHADGDLQGRFSGYKLARPGFSSIPEADDELVRVLYREYGAATGMARDSDAHVSRRMIYYYAFNTRRYAHAIDLGTPAAIIETGFLTHAGDRALLTGRPELAARGIANGVLRFLETELGATGRGS